MTTGAPKDLEARLKPGATSSPTPGATPPFPTTIILIVAAAFCALHAVFLASGVRRGVDSTVYENAARALLQGDVFGGRVGGWLGYKSLLAACYGLGLGPTGVVFIQVFVAAVAAAAVFDIVRRLADTSAGVLAAALVGLNPELARWHHYLLTDSLYTSLLVISVWAIWRAKGSRQRHGNNGWRPRRMLIALALIILTALVRPHGWLLVPVAVVYWFAGLISRPAIRAAVLLGLATGCLAVAVSSPVVRVAGPNRLARGGRLQAMSNEWVLPMPDIPRVTDPQWDTWGDTDTWQTTIEYVLRHPIASAALVAARVCVEALHVRPHYSWRHNVAALALMVVAYTLAFRGFLRLQHDPVRWMLAALIVFNMLPVAARGSDWDSRYGDFVLPLICIFSGCGAPDWLRRRIAALAFPGSRRARTEPASV